MKRKNAGFTLLELVVVVAVMGLISSMAMDVYTDNSNQKRFEATKERLAEIKFAIIGDPMMRVGSQAITEGSFFKDMERLPTNIKELVEYSVHNAHCVDSSNTSASTYTTESTCLAVTGHKWVHWQGPYLNSQSVGGHLVFQDAWGNNGGVDFGWEVTSSTNSFKVQSIGLDRIQGTVGPLNQYEKDYPQTGNLINKVDLNRIDHLNKLKNSSGYCINTSVSNYTIDLSIYVDSTCNTTADRKWAEFP